jgi:hypothetical protein
VANDRIHQMKEHLYTGLAIMDVVGHVEDLNALWRRDSIAYVMGLAFQEWRAADDLLRSIEEDLRESSCHGSHVLGLTNREKDCQAEGSPNGTHQQ